MTRIPHDPFARQGEHLASQHLENHGVTLLHRNWTCPQGEIDLIGTLDEYLLFVEVKARRDLSAGHPLESITARKQKQILRCARVFLKQNPHPEHFPRFDAVSVLCHESPPDIEWVQGAFGEDRC